MWTTILTLSREATFISIFQLCLHFTSEHDPQQPWVIYFYALTTVLRVCQAPLQSSGGLVVLSTHNGSWRQQHYCCFTHTPPSLDTCQSPCPSAFISLRSSPFPAPCSHAVSFFCFSAPLLLRPFLVFCKWRAGKWELKISWWYTQLSVLFHATCPNSLEHGLWARHHPPVCFLCCSTWVMYYSVM